MKAFATLFGFMAASFALQADTLHLRDGRTVHGQFISGTSREIRFLPENSRAEQRYVVSNVDHVTFGATSSAHSGSIDRDRNRAGRYGEIDQTRARNSRYTVPGGTVVTVRLIDPIDSDATDANHSFRASLDEPLVVNGQTIAPRGADATVRVVKVEQGGVISGNEEVAVVLSELMVDGRRYTVDTQHAVVSNKGNEDNLKIIGGTAVVGAIIGAIAGGGKGAAIGAATGAGAGAAVQAIRGQRVKIPSESKLDFTLSDPIYIQ